MKNRREFVKCLAGTVAGIATALVVKPSLDVLGLKEYDERKGTGKFIPTAYHLNQTPIPEAMYLGPPIGCST